MLHINDEEIQGFYEESYCLVTSYVRKCTQPAQQQTQLPSCSAAADGTSPITDSPSAIPSTVPASGQVISFFQPVLQQILLQPQQHVIQATPQPVSRPTSTSTATSTITSGTSQVGAHRGQMWDTAGSLAPAGATPRSDINKSFGLTNISLGLL